MTKSILFCLTTVLAVTNEQKLPVRCKANIKYTSIVIYNCHRVQCQYNIATEGLENTDIYALKP
jgi:hypothetical protein